MIFKSVIVASQSVKVERGNRDEENGIIDIEAEMVEDPETIFEEG